MKNSRIIKVLLFAIVLMLFPIKGYSWWLISGRYYAQLTATVEPEGAGTVYVNGENPDVSAGKNCANVKHTDYPLQPVTFDVIATVNGGYTFRGWSANTSGSPLLSSAYPNYTTGNYYTSEQKSTDSATNASLNYIFAIYDVIPYTLTLLPGDHGLGTQVELGYNAQSDDNLQNHVFTAAPGYQMKDWKVTTAAGYWTPVGETFNTGTALFAKFGSATLTAEWSKKPYNITYNPNGGRIGGSTASKTDTYYIDTNVPARTPTRTGHTFSGWKVTSVNTSEGNWVLNQLIPDGTTLTGQYGVVTLTAQWDIQYGDITITVNGLDGDDSAMFRISSGGSVLYTVTVTASNPSVTIKNLQTDIEYLVTPVSDWNWYTMSPTSASHTLTASGHTFEFTATAKTKKHDETFNVNWKP